MTTVEGTKMMKLSKQTCAILKSMAGINSNLHVLPGNELVCVSPGKNIMFQATVEENFTSEFAIWDLEPVSRNLLSVQRSNGRLR